MDELSSCRCRVVRRRCFPTWTDSAWGRRERRERPRHRRRITSESAPMIATLFRFTPSSITLTPTDRPSFRSLPVGQVIIPPWCRRPRRRSSPSRSWRRCRRSGSGRRGRAGVGHPAVHDPEAVEVQVPRAGCVPTVPHSLDPVPAGRQDHAGRELRLAKSDRTINRPCASGTPCRRLRSPPCVAGSDRAPWSGSRRSRWRSRTRS